MLEENQFLFNEFKKLEPTDETFNEMGNKVLRIVRRYEDELCSK